MTLMLEADDLIQIPYVRQFDCPAWCSEHGMDGTTMEGRWVSIHCGEVTVGEITVELAREIRKTTSISDLVSPPDLDWINGQDLLDLVTALMQAHRLLFEGGSVLVEPVTR